MSYEICACWTFFVMLLLAKIVTDKPQVTHTAPKAQHWHTHIHTRVPNTHTHRYTTFRVVWVLAGDADSHARAGVTMVLPAAHGFFLDVCLLNDDALLSPSVSFSPSLSLSL